MDDDKKPTIGQSSMKIAWRDLKAEANGTGGLIALILMIAMGASLLVFGVWPIL